MFTFVPIYSDLPDAATPFLPPSDALLEDYLSSSSYAPTHAWQGHVIDPSMSV